MKLCIYWIGIIVVIVVVLLVIGLVGFVVFFWGLLKGVIEWKLIVCFGCLVMIGGIECVDGFGFSLIICIMDVCILQVIWVGSGDFVWLCEVEVIFFVFVLLKGGFVFCDVKVSGFCFVLVCDKNGCINWSCLGELKCGGLFIDFQGLIIVDSVIVYCDVRQDCQIVVCFIFDLIKGVCVKGIGMICGVVVWVVFLGLSIE